MSDSDSTSGTSSSRGVGGSGSRNRGAWGWRGDVDGMSDGDEVVGAGQRKQRAETDNVRRRSRNAPPPVTTTTTTTISTMQTPPSPPPTESDGDDSRSPGTEDHGNNSHDLPRARPHNTEAKPERVSSPVTSPPYWTTTATTGTGTGTGQSRGPQHGRHASAESISGGMITLRDNENSDSLVADVRNHACWAKSVDITDHVVVNGSATNIGAFVVWNVRVETLSVCIFFVSPSLPSSLFLVLLPCSIPPPPPPP
jgi:hypothetical protein